LIKSGWLLEKIEKEKINRILVIKLRGIGDVVLSTIVLNNLKLDFPNSLIDYLVELPSSFGVKGLQNVNDVLIFHRNDFWQKVKLIFQIKKNKYDLVIDLFSNPSTAIITYLSGAKYRAGFPYRGRKYAYNRFGPIERGKFHSADLNLQLLKNLGIASSCKELQYYIDKSSKQFAEKYVRDNFLQNDFIVGICPTGGWPSKKCDPEKFIEFAKAIKNKFGAKLLILWGKSDELDAKIIFEGLEEISIIAPPTSIQEMAALISQCNLLIANDSGPMHISTAIGTPVLSLHGPTSPYMQGPFGSKHEWLRLDSLNCIECNLLDCPKNHECFKFLSSELVLEKVQNLIEKNNLKILA
jgi:ADP-heptose:LPS heptosyltransferase